VKGHASKTPLSGKTAGNIDINVFISEDHPPSYLEPVTIEWSAVSPVSLREGSDITGDVTFNDSFTPSRDLRGTKSTIAVFMPCNTVVLFNSQSYCYSNDIVRQVLIQNYYHELKLLENSSQCSRAGDISVLIDNICKKKLIIIKVC
jgi:hypothetical protein